jgi:hypothetical protein
MNTGIPTYYSTLLATSAGLAALHSSRRRPPSRGSMTRLALTPIVRALSFVVLLGGLRGVSQGVIARQLRLAGTFRHRDADQASPPRQLPSGWPGKGTACGALSPICSSRSFFKRPSFCCESGRSFTLRPQAAVIRKILPLGWSAHRQQHPLALLRQRRLPGGRQAARRYSARHLHDGLPPGHVC